MADLRRHRSSTTFVVSSLFLASRPLSSQRGHGGFFRGSKHLLDFPRFAVADSLPFNQFKCPTMIHPDEDQPVQDF